MNLFQEDFGLSSAPLYTRKQSGTSLNKYSNNNDILSKKPSKKDDFDDLLEQLMSKQQKKVSKKKQKQPSGVYSSTFIQNNPSPIDFKKTQKWSTPNIEFDLNQSPKFPIVKRNSFIQDKGSEDGRSYRSGYTRPQQSQVDNLITLRGPDPMIQQAPLLQRSSRNMMKPPLRKRESKQAKDFKQPSIWGESMTGRRNKQQQDKSINIGNFSLQEKKNKDVEQNTNNKQIKQRIIQRQKIITVRQDASQLKKQFQNQLKQLKESYERQSKLLQTKKRQEIQQMKRKKDKLIQQLQNQLKKQKQTYSKLLKQNSEKMKQIFDWQMKRKCQNYQMQIQKLKQFSKIQDNIQKHQQIMEYTQNNAELRNKQRLFELEKQKFDTNKTFLQQKERVLRSEQQKFQNYRRKQQDKIRQQQRKLAEKQSQLKRLQLQTKRILTNQRQKMATQLGNAQIEIIKKKQSLNLQRDQFQINKQLFERQKNQFEQFNRNIISDYKIKLKQLDTQKQNINELQIQLHKKIQTVQLMGGKDKETKDQHIFINTHKKINNQQNYRNRSNTQIQSKINNVKERFKQMETEAKKNSFQTHQQRERVRQNIDLSGYINKINKSLSRY